MILIRENGLMSLREDGGKGIEKYDQSDMCRHGNGKGSQKNQLIFFPPILETPISVLIDLGIKICK